jgi:hypothetical membrane protein
MTMRNLAFACAVLSLLILALAAIAGGFAYPGYNHLTQYISELGATGATTGQAVSGAFMASGVLLAVFWLLCIGLFPKSPLSVIGFGLSALNGLGLMFGGVFPCDFECSLEGASSTAVLHDVLGGIGYLCGVVGLMLVGLAARNWPGGRNLFHLAIVCGAPAAGAIWLINPAFEFYGAAQRVLEIALAVWTVGVALAIRRPMATA